MPARDVAKLHSRVAGVYDAWTFFTESRSLDVALDASGIRDSDAVLEVAVGTGIAFREPRDSNPRHPASEGPFIATRVWKSGRRAKSRRA